MLFIARLCVAEMHIENNVIWESDLGDNSIKNINASIRNAFGSRFVTSLAHINFMFYSIVVFFHFAL